MLIFIFIRFPLFFRIIFQRLQIIYLEGMFYYRQFYQIPIRRKEILMKATGIVRRIDDLGRVVIPKEIRRTMRIREGDPLEIYTDREGEVIFKKYSPIGELSEFASQYAETLHKTGSLSVLITDRDAVIAVAGVPKKEYLEKGISDELDTLMKERNSKTADSSDKFFPTHDAGSYYVSCAYPIISDGDVVGSVVSLSRSDEQKNEQSICGSDTERRLVMTAAAFLGKQLES